jgi:hypothetical protein
MRRGLPPHLIDANQEYAHAKSRALASQHVEGKSLLLAEEIGGLIARFPFDITANTWLLNWIDRLICQHSLDGCPQVLSRHRHLIAGSALVQLPSIDQCALTIK